MSDYDDEELRDGTPRSIPRTQISIPIVGRAAPRPPRMVSPVPSESLPLPPSRMPTSQTGTANAFPAERSSLSRAEAWARGQRTYSTSFVSRELAPGRT